MEGLASILLPKFEKCAAKTLECALGTDNLHTLVPTNGCRLPSEELHEVECVKGYARQAFKFERPSLRREMDEFVPKFVQPVQAYVMCCASKERARSNKMEVVTVLRLGVQVQKAVEPVSRVRISFVVSIEPFGSALIA